MRFRIDINIKKIVKKDGLYIIYCDKPRALGEILRHNHGIPLFAMTIWGQGVTLMPPEFARVKDLFKECKEQGIEVKEE